MDGDKNTKQDFMEYALLAAETVEKDNLALFDLQADQVSVGEAVAAREADAYERVCMMKDDDGKLKYGNDGVRKAAASKLQGSDAVLVTARAKHKQLARDIAVAKYRIDKNLARIAIYKAFLHGGGQA
jgi:hypothetical protein